MLLFSNTLTLLYKIKKTPRKVPFVSNIINIYYNRTATLELITIVVNVPRENTSLCTGVAIADNLLLTANHCTIQKNKKDNDYGKPYFDVGDQINLYIPQQNGQLSTAAVVKGISRGWSSKQYPSIRGDDIAIIEFNRNTFKSVIPKNQIISVHGQNSSANSIVDDLVKKLWLNNKLKSIYVIGWGSHKKFEYAFRELDDDVMKKKNMYSQFATGLQEKDNTITPCFNYPDRNNKYNSWGPDFIGGVYKSGNKSLLNASLPNHFALGGDTTGSRLTDPGDSGGPVFICDSSRCELFGVLSGVLNPTVTGKDDIVTIITTLANPFYELIAKPYGM